MGVPKFFRWLSERYPCVNQRYTVIPDADRSNEFFDRPPLPPLTPPDPTSKCGLPPQVDRLYLDMNGIIHGCSHNNDGGDEAANAAATKGSTAAAGAGAGTDAAAGGSDNEEAPGGITDEDICRNVCYYLDRVVGEMANPQELLYMAIDGVAPRAKLNQQRSRRYRSGTEGAIEMSLYDAHILQMQESERERNERNQDLQNGMEIDESYSFMVSPERESTTLPNDIDPGVREVSPGRFQGKIQTSSEKLTVSSAGNDDSAGGSPIDPSKLPFHSISITPGTPFFQKFTDYLEHFIKFKVSTDPKWQNLTIIFSGPNVPGEGEHKIMQFIREQKQRDDYNPNLSHCIMGQDGDWMMLSLAAHEPNMVILREQIIFDSARRMLAEKKAADRLLDSDGSGETTFQSMAKYIFNPHFEFLHVGILRDYLAFEFETSNVVHGSPWDLERTVDDFVFMTFFVGNDFLPHMPALDIGDNAFDLLFYTYKQCRAQWLKEYREKEKAGILCPKGTDMPYLTQAGEIASGSRLEHFFSRIGAHEDLYYDKKKMAAAKSKQRMRMDQKKYGHVNHIPEDKVIESKEQSDRAAYREMLASSIESADLTSNNDLVLSEKLEFEPEDDDDDDDDDADMDKTVFSRMGSLLKNSLSSGTDEEESDGLTPLMIDDQDLKGRYYYDKFKFTPFDAKKHADLRKAYIEGLVWNLKYYYEGCVSWDWFYPYHYGPMLSDLKDIDEILEKISFEGRMGEPLKPFEQLMGCMPPSHAHNLPEPFRWLMKEENSPIHDFFPKSFTVDMNGKRWPWEAVVLLPFIDSKRLLEAARSVDESQLSDQEKERNKLGNAYVLTYDSEESEFVPAIGSGSTFGAIEKCRVKSVPFSNSGWQYTQKEKPVLTPELKPGVEFPLPGFGSLRDAIIESLSRDNIGVNVFGFRSPYKTACLKIVASPIEDEPIEEIASRMVGSTIFVNYPYFTEAFVTAISNKEGILRGKDQFKNWENKEGPSWVLRRDAIIRQYKLGAGLCGSGGLVVPENPPIIVSARPLKEIAATKFGAKVKVYADFEVEVPLSMAQLSPSRLDPRLSNLPKKLEDDPYHGFLPVQKHVEGSGKSRKSMLPPIGTKSALAEKIRRKKMSSNAQFHSTPLNGIQKRSIHDFPGSSHEPSISAYPSIHHDLATTTRRLQPVARPKLFRVDRPARRAAASLPRGGGRGGLVAAGALAMSLFFNSTNASHTPSSPFDMSRDLFRPTDVGFNPAFSKTLGFKNPAETFLFDDILGLRGGDTQPLTELSTPVPPLEFAHGTTTLSFIFNGGIVAAVDSRASMGNFVGSKTTQKVLVVNSHILGTMAGGAADCQFFLRVIQAEAALHELKEDRRMSVARASRLLSDMLYQNRMLNLSVGTMIMGFDENERPSIYYVDSSGKRIGGDVFAVGSGSTYALGILDTERHNDMSEDEAVALGIKAIRHATFRDAFSGGYINVYVITKDGWKKVFTGDLARNVDE